MACDTPPVLSWDSNSWVHGRITAHVIDHTGTEVAAHTVSTNAHGNQTVAGQGPDWRFAGTTMDANGNAEIRLTCQ